MKKLRRLFTSTLFLTLASLALFAGTAHAVTIFTVPQGGTGNGSFTAYGVITGGTTSTGALQTVSGLGTSGQVLTSNGAGALPSWQSASGGSTLAAVSALSTDATKSTYTFTNNVAVDFTGNGALVVRGTVGSGWTEPNYGAGTRMFFYPRKGAFRAGSVAGTEWNDANIGVYSFSVGNTTKASGTASTTFGESTIASGNYSAAFGKSTTASAIYSLAGGNSSQASASSAFAWGTSAMASGVASTALGNSTSAGGDSSFAAGYLSSTGGTGAMALGEFATAVGEASLATGFFSTANAVGSVAMGGGSTAYSPFETVVGGINTSYTPSSTTNWVGTDRLFVVGNGDAVNFGTPSDALVILKNGNSTFTGNMSLITGDLSLPARGQRINIGDYGTISTTLGGAAYITGDGIAASQSVTNTVIKTVNDDAQFIRMRYDTGIAFHTNLTGSVGTTYADSANERMIIDLAGNVGIGTSSPAYRLTVKGTGNTSGTVSFATLDSSGNATFFVRDNGVVEALTGIEGGGYMNASTIRVDGSAVFDTSGFRLDIGSAGGFTSATIVSGATALLQLGGTSSSFPALQVSSGDFKVIGADASTAKNLNITGGLFTGYVAKTSTYTASATDSTIDCTSGTFTVNLPTAVGITGRTYVIKNTGAGTITVDAAGSETIDGATTQSLSVQYQSITIQSNGANWIVI